LVATHVGRLGIPEKIIAGGRKRRVPAPVRATCPFRDWPLPLVALQIFWLDMITDVFLALALEPSDRT